MMRQKFKNRFLAGIMAVMLALFMGAGISAVPVRAARGNIYSCKITPCYAHPVTGTIEDSGGSASYATGQGMVEGAVYTTGMMEVTDSGEYYLTVRMSLVDYTSNHSFTVQNVGDSGWSSTSMGVTGTGSDTNGTTADVCIQVPSENCVVRGSMYVTPMGRNVIFYFYPSNYAAGGVDGMNATMVTEASGSGNGTDAAEDSSSAESEEYIQQESEEYVQEDGEQTSAAASDSQTAAVQTPALESSLSGTAAIPAETEAPSAGGAELNSAKGLSLSTEQDEAMDGTGASKGDAGSQVMVLTLSITISGLILLTAGALTVYYFRKNWRRWGGADDDEDE